MAGTSARVGGLFRRQALGTPSEILPHLLEFMPRGPVALVFGPEPTGLTNTEVSRCHYLITIPTDPVYPALNLAQAVAICLYELRRLWLSSSVTPIVGDQPAPAAEQEKMFEKLREGLEQIHFLYGEKADSLMHALRHLIGRAGPTAMEVDVLFGLARAAALDRRTGAAALCLAASPASARLNVKLLAGLAAKTYPPIIGTGSGLSPPGGGLSPIGGCGCIGFFGTGFGKSAGFPLNSMAGACSLALPGMR